MSDENNHNSDATKALADLAGKSGLTPEEARRIARRSVTEQDIANIIRTALEDAEEGGAVASSARAFLKDLVFAPDKDGQEVVRYRRVEFRIMTEEMAEERRRKMDEEEAGVE